MRVILIHNPSAGEGSSSADELMEWLGDSGFAPPYQSTRENGWKSVLKKPAEFVIAAGGDGWARPTATKKARMRIRNRSLRSLQRDCPFIRESLQSLHRKRGTRKTREDNRSQEPEGTARRRERKNGLHQRGNRTAPTQGNSREVPKTKEHGFG